MKRFNTTFTIALAISALALATAYADGESHPAAPSNYIWYDSLQELHELCRLKYRQSRRYEDYARHAAEQHDPDAAALFRAMSRADAVQCANCRNPSPWASTSPARCATRTTTTAAAWRTASTAP